MTSALFLLYAAVGYWAANRTIFANKVLIGSWSKIFAEKLFVGIFLGWLLIPVAGFRIFKNRNKR